MARPVVLTKTLTAGDTNILAEAQTLAAAGDVDLDGVAAGVLDTQRRVLITSAGDDTGVTFTIWGANENGGAIRETVTGADTAAVATNLDFKTVTRIAASGATDGDIIVGTNGVGSTRWANFDMHIPTPNLGLQLALLSGSGNVTVEYTSSPIQIPRGTPAANLGSDTPRPVVTALGSLTSKTANAVGSITTPITGWRLTVNSGTGSWQLTGVPAGISGP